VWLLVIGTEVQEATLNGPVQVHRGPLLSAAIPLTFSLVLLTGLVRKDLGLGWFGAVGILGFGVLFLFGAGPYFPLLGIAAVGAVVALKLSERHKEQAENS